jgi:hypothetical protein
MHLTEDLWRENDELKAERDHLARQLHAARTERDQYKRDLDRSQARVNRMAATAPIEDVNWRPRG